MSSPLKNIPQGLHGTEEDVFLRFHGEDAWYNHNYSDEELLNWAEQVKKYKARKVWAYFNNTNYADAPRNAVRFMKLLKEDY